jgi:hypothetical protein
MESVFTMDTNQLLLALMSQDNSKRMEAENFYRNQCETNTDIIAYQLTACLTLHQVVSKSLICATISLEGMLNYML